MFQRSDEVFTLFLSTQEDTRAELTSLPRLWISVALQTFISVLVKRYAINTLAFGSIRGKRICVLPEVGNCINLQCACYSFVGEKYLKGPQWVSGLLSQTPFSKAGPAPSLSLSKTSTAKRFCDFSVESFPVFYCSSCQKVFLED